MITLKEGVLGVGKAKALFMQRLPYYVLFFISTFIIYGCQGNGQNGGSLVEIAEQKTDLLRLQEGQAYPSGKLFWSAHSRELTHANSYDRAVMQTVFSSRGSEEATRRIAVDQDGAQRLQRLSLLVANDSVAVLTDGILMLLQNLQDEVIQEFYSLYPERGNSLYKGKDQYVLSTGNQWGATTQSTSNRVVFWAKKPISLIRKQGSIELVSFDLNLLEVETMEVHLPVEMVESIYACNPNLFSPQISWTDSVIWVNFQLFPDIFKIDLQGRVAQYTPKGKYRLNEYIPKGQIEQATPQSFWPDPYTIFGSVGYDPTRDVYVQWLAGPAYPPGSTRQRYLRIMDKQFGVLGEVPLGSNEKHGSVIYFLKEGIFIEAMDRELEQTIAGYQVLLQDPER